MRCWSRFGSAFSGRGILIALGVLYVTIAVARALGNILSGSPIIPVLVITTFIGGSGLVLLLGSYRLPDTEINAEFYPTIAKWCFLGIGTMLAILALYHLQPDTGLTEPNRSIPILTGFSAVAGFGVGTNAATAKTNALELERQNRKLKHLRARLEESNDRLEQFAYAASHDLQEPLRMVSSYLQLIESRHGDEFDEDCREFLEYAIDGSERMAEMIDGLLAYSRVDTQGEPFEPVDLDEVLAETRRDLELRIEENDATIVTESLPEVTGDPRQLRQLFQNLISNAIEYSGDEPPRVAVSAERDAETWIISIRDNGIGIDPADQEDIFEVFRRLHSHDEYPGTGIGLAICQQIVSRHGGEIRVESELGEGATFRVTLPAETQSDRRAQVTERPPR